MSDWLNREQAADELGMDLNELQWRLWKRQITFMGRGKLVRFKKEWLDAYKARETKVSKWEEKAKASNSSNSTGQKTGSSRGRSGEKLSAEERGRQTAMKLRNSELPSSFNLPGNVIPLTHSR